VTELPQRRAESFEVDGLTRARQGDLHAFAALIRSHQRTVFGIAARMLRDMHEAEDLAQEVFLQLHRHLPSMETEAHVAFWLRRVTVNRAIDRLRQKPERIEADMSEAEEMAADEAGDDPLLQNRLRGLMGRLPAAPRAVILLRYQEDLDPTEIATTLDMPLNTVKSHLKRSLATLREWLAKPADVVEPGVTVAHRESNL
jgi:RNA polymerase sigma-70 factor, ECF subfamily